MYSPPQEEQMVPAQRQPISSPMTTPDDRRTTPILQFPFGGHPVRTLTTWFLGFLVAIILILLFVPLPPFSYGIIAIITTLAAVVFAIVTVQLAYTAPS